MILNKLNVKSPMAQNLVILLAWISSAKFNFLLVG